MTVHPGKVRGLQQCANSAGLFTILALDHSPGYVLGGEPDFDAVVAQKGRLLTALSPRASAVLLDPGHGLPAAVFGQSLPGSAGLLLAAEDGSYQTPGSEKRAKILDGWSIAKIKRSGASAVKIFFYYHPDDPEGAAAEEAFVRQAAADCRVHDLPLFAEPLSFGITSEERPQIVIETARRISALDIDVLKVEFPVDSNVDDDEEHWREACQALNEACRTPWALLSAGVSFEIFARQVEIACQAGASGFLAGRAIWSEAAELKGAELDSFLVGKAADRLSRLADIATEHGRPWDAGSQMVMPGEGWYRGYEVSS
jgi:tagatose 1,6-diphosphate aldolase